MKILYLVSRVPYELDKGDKLRAFHQIRILSRKHQIILFALTDEPVPEGAVQTLKQYCTEVTIVPITRSRSGVTMLGAIPKRLPFQIAYYYNKEAQKEINRLVHIHQPDHIFCQLIRMAEYVKKFTNIPKTLDYMDAVSKTIQRRGEKAPFYQKPFFRVESKLLRQYESKVFNLFNNKIIISEQDRYHIQHAHKYTLQIVPNGVDCNYYKTQPAGKTHAVLLAGNLGYAPNIEAARYLIKKIMPLVWPYAATINVLLAGKNPSPEVLALASDRVQVTGNLPDLRDAYKAANIFVAPLFVNTGLQNKILEAMAMGLPCVTTRPVNNAIGAKKVEQILLADSAQGFAAHILYLWHHPEEAGLMGIKGQEFVQKQYNWDLVTARLEQVLQ